MSAKDDESDGRESARMPANLRNVFDHAEALERMEGDAELLAELATLFLDTYAEKLSFIRAAVAHHDADTVKRAAHEIKGAVANLSARETFDAAQKLEGIALRGNLRELEPACLVLDEALKQLNEALHDLCKAQRPNV